MTGQRPHQLLKLDKALNTSPTRWYRADNRAYSDGTLLDFDHAVLDFWEWVQAKQEEQKPVATASLPQLPNKGKAHTWGRKYRTMGEIFKLYFYDPTEGIDPDVAAIDIGELLADLDTFDMTEMEYDDGA